MPSKLRAKQAKIEAKKKDTLPSPPKNAPTTKRTKSKPSEQAQSHQKNPNRNNSELSGMSPNTRLVPAQNDNGNFTSGIKKIKSDELIVPATTQSRTVIDEIVPNKEQFNLFREGKKIYSAFLSKQNQKEKKFYIIQVLQHKTTEELFIWNRWGKVGVQGQDALKGPFSNQKAAISQYNRKYFDKTAKRDYVLSKIQAK